MTQLIKVVDGVEVPLTPEEIEEFNQQTQEWEQGANQRLYDECQRSLEILINESAKEKLYNDAVSCASYKDSSNAQWAAEAAAFIAWRDYCYEYAFDYIQQAEDGTIEPSLDGFMNGLPPLVWPEQEG